ncbi:hypothetical protein EV178_002584 [Coemansia sp. RSA 1646]|nr:hypothetical protein EV178_002584 [Coemansia sp. RSA 1646]KAJ1769678.1 hypothetical protein LPJ74_003830 [Coemansia sp. RSA 1843]KAJ2211644.1 hypothetical protein EV179_005316 [Coemansia sp. RSA 487]
MDLSNEGSGWAKTNTDLAVLPTNSTGYGTKECWQQRYAQEPDCCFGWFKTYMNLEPLPSKHIATKAAQILMLGCGNSTLSGDMYIAGHQNFVNADFSNAAIERMRD